MGRVRIATLFVLAALVVPAASFAAKTTYIATNHRFNYVKLKEVKKSVAEARGMTHPARIDEQGLKIALKSIMLSRSYLIKKQVDTQRVFDDYAAEFLAHNMSIAFAQAKPDEQVVFSYLQKNPIFVIRNDRINLGKAWLQGDKLHIKFTKLYAKVTGDIDKRGNESKAIAKARGLRIRLDLKSGQMMAVDDPEELILDINYNYAKDLEEEKQKEPEVIKTMAGEEIAAPTAPAAKGGKAAASSAATTTTAGTAVAANSSGEEGIESRLRTLDQLRKDNLITNKEYKEKKKEILKDL